VLLCIPYVTVMKKMSAIVAIVLVTICTGFAQFTEVMASLKAFTADTVTGWKKGATIFINTSQTSLTNWSAGGQNSLSINGLTTVFANYREKNINWDNTLDVGYGIMKQGKINKLIKTDDKIDFFSKYGYRVVKEWYFSALFNFRTQITKGFKNPGDSVPMSNFLAPGYFLGAIGFDYKKHDIFSVFISPFTSKVTLVYNQALSDSGAFGVDRGKKLRSETGGYVRVIVKKNIAENVTFGIKVDLFSNYINQPQNIDINWETMLNLKANAYLSASLATHLVYDDDIKVGRDTDNDGVVDKRSARVQFKEMLSIGVTLKF